MARRFLSPAAESLAATTPEQLGIQLAIQLISLT